MKVKKIIALFLVIFIFVKYLFACTSIESMIPTDEKGKTIQINYLEQLPKTDKLVLYRTPINSWVLDPAVKIFEEIYPDVEVEVRDFGIDEYSAYETFIQTELPAGKGPDLIVVGNEDFPNVFKIMETGVFCDLNDFIGSDPDFALDDYNKVVMDSGVYKGKRYLAPINYETNILFTNEEALAAAGMDKESFKTFDGYAGEIKKYLEKYSSTKLVYKDYLTPNIYFPWNGLRVIDYENKKTNVDGEDFKKVVDAYKDLFAQDIGSFAGYDTIEALRKGDILFHRMRQTLYFAQLYGVMSIDSSPIYFPFPGINGKTTAEVKTSASVLASAQNKANAYAFLKILLSEKIQFPDIMNFYYMPVLDSVLDEMVSAAVEFMEKWIYDGVLAPVSADVIKDYLDMYADVDDCQLYVREVMNEVFETYMMPYFKDEDTYENCLNRTRNFLELYISE